MLDLSDKLKVKIWEKIPNEFITHFNSTNFGNVIEMMEKNGIAFCQFYWYFNDNTLYIGNLSINENERQKGIGNSILNIFEQIGKTIEAEYLGLNVEINNFAYEWYKRHKFIDFQVNAENYMWMKKLI